MMVKALVTGFEGYGGRGRNPAGETALALDGKRAPGGATIVGRRLPVSYKPRLAAALEALIDEVEPDIVISLGLWPGRADDCTLERIGINVADFEIPDNEGTLPARPAGQRQRRRRAAGDPAEPRDP